MNVFIKKAWELGYDDENQLCSANPIIYFHLYVSLVISKGMKIKEFFLTVSFRCRKTETNRL